MLPSEIFSENCTNFHQNISKICYNKTNRRTDKVGSIQKMNLHRSVQQRVSLSQVPLCIGYICTNLTRPYKTSGVRFEKHSLRELNHKKTILQRKPYHGWGQDQAFFNVKIIREEIRALDINVSKYMNFPVRLALVDVYRLKFLLHLIPNSSLLSLFLSFQESVKLMVC